MTAVVRGDEQQIQNPSSPAKAYFIYLVLEQLSCPDVSMYLFLSVHIFPLLYYSPMIKTGIQTLPPQRGFYHRFYSSVHLSHQAPQYCRRAGGEDGGNVGHLCAEETSTCRTELRNQQLSHSRLWPGDWPYQGTEKSGSQL